MGPAPLYIYGAGGHGQVVAEAAAAAGWRVVAFLDDAAHPGAALGPAAILPPAEVDRGVPVLVAIGDNSARRRVAEMLLAQGVALATVVHPSAWVSPSARLGAGVYVGPHAAVNAEARLAEGVIVNSGAIVEHHADLGAWAHLGPRVALGGRVRVGELSLLGVGACVRPGVQIGAGCTIGAGAAVVADVPAGATAWGVPARVQRHEG